ncbi:MAG: hypothetical protein J07AB43_13780 [Candidatus Nanosalina sp. J07AB43]|nr:MAG: hypothetical protein J07AB43_13780 [Candidatus Nanosalina sp. J07AB43]
MKLNDVFDEKLESGMDKNIFLVAVCILIVGVSMGAHNLATPEKDMNVGLVEIETQCAGIEAGVCIGFETQQHQTYNYANYSKAEKGDPNYFRRVESELMAQAYNICNQENITEYEWTSKATYDNQTGKEWRQEDEVQLLPCGDTFHRDLDAES